MTSTKGKESTREAKTVGITFTEAEEAAVRSINDVADLVDDANRQIGQIVDDLVAKRGGIKYGEKTLERLARHPALKCSREQLRRCWQFFRFAERYADDLDKVAPDLAYSHQYQLSRLLDIEKDDAQREAVLAMATDAAANGMTATELAQAVSTHLKSIGKAIRKKPLSKERQAQADACSALIDAAPMIVEATRKVVSAAEIERVAEVRLAANKLGFAYVQLANKLVGIDADAEQHVRKMIVCLTELLENKNDNQGEANEPK